MNAEELKSDLNKLGWGTEAKDIIRYYFAVLRANSIRCSNLSKHPDMRYAQAYAFFQKKDACSGFAEEFPQLAFDWQADLFDERCAEVAQLSLQTFVEMLLPGKVKNPSFFAALENQYENVFYQCYCLYLLFRISSDLEPDMAHKHYCAIYSGKDAPLTKETFRKLFCLMNWREVRDETSIKAAAKEANTLLTTLIVSNSKKCEIVAEVLTRLDRLKSKDIQAPAAYLSKILYDDSKAYQNVNASGTIDKLIKHLSKSITFMDFLSVLMSDGGRGENLAECGFLLPWLREKWTGEDRPPILLVNAVPSFLSAWGLTWADSLTVPFGTAKKSVSETVDAAVYDMSELNSIVYAKDQVVLYFARGYEKEEVSGHLQALCRENAVVYVILPDTYKDVTVQIPGYAVDCLTILPTEIFRGGKTKNFVARLLPEDTEMIKAQTAQVKTIERRVYSAPPTRWEETTIAPEDYESNQTLRALFHQAVAKKENIKERERPQAYPFSPELTLWYIVKRKEEGTAQVCLYLCEVPTEQQKKRNKYPRGKKIKSTETWNTNIPETEIVEWIETRGAFNEKLRTEAIRQIELHHHKNMSLKSLWYCLYDHMTLSEENTDTLLRFLRSEQGTQLVIGEASEGEIEEAIRQAGESTDVLVPALDTLFELAVKRKVIKVHPFEELRAIRKKQQRREESIRALAKRSYTEAEEERIWEYFQKNHDVSGVVGMILCFLTGLTPPYVAALTWRDWRRITYTDHMQLVVNKKLLPDGTVEWQTDEDNCRLIPSMDLVKEVLDEWKCKREPAPEDRIILVENGDPLTAIRKQIREAEKYAGIAPDLIRVPDSDKQTDLNQYAGSRMRENFSRHCYADCGMTDAEVHHLILRKMPDTLSKNYVDYGHECIQERIAVKLNQWGQRFQKPEAERGLRKMKITKKKVTLVPRGNKAESYHLMVRTEEKIKVITDCNHDYDYQFLIRIEEE